MNRAVYNEERERREASRMGRDEACEFALVSMPAGTMRAEVLEESLGGMRLVVLGSASIASGDLLDITYARQTIHGKVCHVQPRSDGKLILGIDCGPLSRS